MYIYICTHTHTHIYTHIYIYIDAYVHVYIYMYTSIHINTCMYTKPYTYHMFICNGVCFAYSLVSKTKNGVCYICCIHILAK